MQCPLCKTELRIKGSRTVVENDDSPDKETRVYIEQELVCVNKKCENYQKVVSQQRAYLI
mgnify:CR=1 FL=1